MRVFISSTFIDLHEYRAAVSDQIRRMKIEGEEMEFFGASDSDPAAYSIDILDTCNVYLGIIGHRYGTISSDGRRSVTHCEYDRAYELYEQNKMRLLIYLADSGMLVAYNQIEKDKDLSERLANFKKLLQQRHTPQFFKSPAGLASQVAADIHWLVTAGRVRDQEIEIFDADQVSLIEDWFDRAANERLGKIHEFLDFIAKSFGNLFNLNPKQIDIHPFFKEVYSKLGSIIPGVYLNEKDGMLYRTGVRHVIMRTETMRLLVQGLSGEQLRIVGREIGNSASSDLIQHTIKRGGLFPSSGEAFVTLWGFWDQTGGWGILTPVRPPEETSDSESRADKSVLHIRLRNNFLQTENLKETHRLCNFWCGYIHGFFETALPQIADLMGDLSVENSRRVTLPAYHKVSSVAHLEDQTLEEDVFCVTFAREPLSEALETLRDSRWAFKRGEYRGSMVMCRSALRSARDVLKEEFEELLKSLGTEEKSKDFLAEILNSNFPPKQDHDTANRWFETVNLALKHFWRAKAAWNDETPLN